MFDKTITKATTYQPQDCAAFMKSRDRYGELSNMTFGFPLTAKGIAFQSSEGLYQAFKFPHDSRLQQEIGEAQSGMEAKKIAYRRGNTPMEGWDDRRIDAMILALATKLYQHPESFSNALMRTSGLTIVEKSYRDDFWGAKPSPAGMVGSNVLGRLLQELRCQITKINDFKEAARQFAAGADKTGLIINGQSTVLSLQGT